MRKALLYQKKPQNKVRCLTCQHYCLIKENHWGFCQTRINKKGKLLTAIYGLVSAVNLDPIEKKPVFHYQPTSACLSLGTFGCNFHCSFCQNWEISHTTPTALEIKEKNFLSAKEAVALAKKSGAQGIAWTYNEPAIWLEYSLAGAKLAKKAGLYTGWVTNGYASREAIDKIAPYLDFYRVDLKSFSKTFYQKLIGPIKPKNIFQMTKYLHQKYPKVHIECVTNIIPQHNDSPANLKKISGWIKENLGPKTPWHVTRFFPYGQLTNVPPTPAKTLRQARKIGQDQGLQFVYTGNLEVDKEDDTFCPKCQNLAIRRTGYKTEILGVNEEGLCLDCQEDLNIRFY